jgi:hypothetical protein
VFAALASLAERGEADAVGSALAGWLAKAREPPEPLIPDDLLAGGVKLAGALVEWGGGAGLGELVGEGAWGRWLGPRGVAGGGGEEAFVAACGVVRAWARRGGVGAVGRLLGRRGSAGAALGVARGWAARGQEPEPPPAPKGLKNQGNTCYMNCVLQQLM